MKEPAIDRAALGPSATWQNLERRAALLKSVRTFFDERGFLEVETPLLSADVVVDRHLDPLAVTLPHDPRTPGVGRQMWLQTSPEFAMKRLMAAGAKAIYQVARAFRGGESGPLHNPEFTLLEWYRAGDDMAAAISLLSDLAEATLSRGPAVRIAYADAFQKHVGLDPHRASAADLAAAARRLGVAAPETLEADDRDGWLDLLLVERVEQYLGRERPAILYDYPAGGATLARLRGGPPPVAERFELYVDGIELANGYHELLDAAELRKRSAQANRLRARDGKPQLPEHSRLVEAMEAGLPPCAGVALGFDRLMMIACGTRQLADVMAFPIDRA